MITSLNWISRNACLAVPLRVEYKEARFAKDSKLEKTNILGNQKERGEGERDEYSDIMLKYGLDDYDEDHGSRHVSHANNTDSVYVDQEMLEDELFDITIREDDLVLACTIVDDDENIRVEMYIYEEEEENLYVHHDIPLLSYPICSEWLSCPGVSGGDRSTCTNLVAIGSFSSEIEIWDLDYLDPLYPKVVLGSHHGDRCEDKKNVENKEAVMCLSWNVNCNNLMLSGLANNSVRLWDIFNPLQPIRVYENHSDKVQSVSWCPESVSLFASAGYDKSLYIFDSRSPSDRLLFGLGGEAEMLKWDCFNEYRLGATDDLGFLYYLDIRKFSSNQDRGSMCVPEGTTRIGSVFSTQSHNDSVTSLDFSPTVSSLLMTSSLDNTLKLWNLDSSGAEPELLFSKNPQLGKIFGSSFSRDSPLALSCFGEVKDPAMLNLSSEILQENGETLKSFMEDKLRRIS